MDRVKGNGFVRRRKCLVWRKMREISSAVWRKMREISGDMRKMTANNGHYFLLHLKNDYYS